MKGKYIRRYPVDSPHKSKQVPKKSRRGILKLLVVLVCMSLFLGGGYYLMWWQALMIRQVEVVNGGELEANLVSRTYDHLDTHKSWIYNPYNIFLVPVRPLEKYLEEKFPSLSTIRIKRSLTGDLTLYASVADPALAVCGSDTVCAEVSDQGLIIGFLDRVAASELLIILDEFPRKAGDRIFSEREVVWLLTIKSMFQDQLGVPILGLAITQRYESAILATNIVTKEGYYIKLDHETDIVAQAESLRRVFDTELGVAKRTNLEYIDLRINGRVYYKFKQ